MKRQIKLIRWLLVLVPVLAFAQGPRAGMRGMDGGGFPSWWERPWWDSPLVRDLNLSDAQRNEIRTAVRDFRERIIDARANLQKADANVEESFSDNPVDQKKANDAIERLAAARGELTRTLSLMSLRIRSVLTPEQYEELARRRPGRGFEGRGRRFNGPPPGGVTKQ